MTLKFYKCTCATPHLHKISNLTKTIVSTGQSTFDYKVLKRYMIRKIVKQGIIWLSNMQIRYFKDFCELCLDAPKKMHKYPYKHRFIAGSSKCTTKDLSCLLTQLLSTIKDELVRYCNTKTIRKGVNNLWILKNSTSLLSSLDQLHVRTATSVDRFDFSTLYTSIPYDLLKSRISNLVHNAFRKKDGSV